MSSEAHHCTSCFNPDRRAPWLTAGVSEKCCTCCIGTDGSRPGRFPEYDPTRDDEWINDDARGAK